MGRKTSVHLKLMKKIFSSNMQLRKKMYFCHFKFFGNIIIIYTTYQTEKNE